MDEYIGVVKNIEGYHDTWMEMPVNHNKFLVESENKTHLCEIILNSLYLLEYNLDRTLIYEDIMELKLSLEKFNFFKVPPTLCSFCKVSPRETSRWVTNSVRGLLGILSSDRKRVKNF